MSTPNNLNLATFNDAAHDYSVCLDLAVQQRVLSGNVELTPQLERLAARLGKLMVGPREVVELHSAALRQRLAQSGEDQTEIYAAEGRMLLLELMGLLLLYYRDRPAN